MGVNVADTEDNERWKSLLMTVIRTQPVSTTTLIIFMFIQHQRLLTLSSTGKLLGQPV